MDSCVTGKAWAGVLRPKHSFIRSLYLTRFGRHLSGIDPSCLVQVFTLYSRMIAVWIDPPTAGRSDASPGPPRDYDLRRQHGRLLWHQWGRRNRQQGTRDWPIGVCSVFKPELNPQGSLESTHFLCYFVLCSSFKPYSLSSNPYSLQIILIIQYFTIFLWFWPYSDSLSLQSNSKSNIARSSSSPVAWTPSTQK